MSNVEKFEELLRTDEGLQQKMREAMAAYKGDKADERAVFDAVIAPLAAEAGLPFTFEDSIDRVESGSGLSNEELADIAGGSFCLLFGGDDVRAKECHDVEKLDKMGAGACAYVGVGVVIF